MKIISVADATNPLDGYRKMIATVEVEPGLYTDAMCVLTAAPYAYLMQDEDGYEFYDDNGGIPSPPNASDVIDFVEGQYFAET